MKTLVFDTETTGLTLPSLTDVKNQPRIIEFGGALVEDGVVIDTVSQLINPGVELPTEITKITGINPEDLEGQPTFPEMWPSFRQLFVETDLVVAHNAPFDVSMVNYELQRIEEVFTWPDTMCSAQEFTHMFGFTPRLVQLYEKVMGEPLPQTHRALDDALALTAVLLKMGVA